MAKRKLKRKQYQAAQKKRAASASAKKSLPQSRTRAHKPDVRIDMAQAAWQNGQYDEAIRCYEQALAKDPRNPTLLTDMARAYGLRYRMDDAEQVLNRLKAVIGDDGHAMYMLAETYFKFKDFEASAQCCRDALARGLDEAEEVRVLVALSRMDERLHRLDESRDAAERALAMRPDHPNANLYYARVLYRQGDKDAAAARYEALTKRRGLAHEVYADAWYGIAAHHDKQGDYDAAYAAFRSAKQAYKPVEEVGWRDARRVQQNNERMLAAITADHFERWHADAEKMAPLSNGQAWLIGHPRSGTTLLEQVLDSHDGLVSADELEVFASSTYPQLAGRTGVKASAPLPNMLDRADAWQLDLARGEYLRQVEGVMRQPVAGRVLLDKNPELTLLLPVISRVFPESKVLFALRDPRDVVLSCFMQPLPLNSVSVHYHTLELAAEKYKLMLNGWLKMRDMLKCGWIEVKYEDTVDDLASQARRSLDFLGLPWDDQVLQYRQRAKTKHVHSPTYEAVTQPVYRTAIGRWKNYEKHMGSALDILQPLVEVLGYA